MTRRRIHMILHWSIFLLILALIKGGASAPWVRWLFVGGVAVWVAIALVKGLKGKPGPKLSARTRAAYPWMHRTLYASLSVSAVLMSAELLGFIGAGPAWIALLIAFGFGAFHGLFQFWRHAALYDGALYLITPKFTRKVL